MARQLKRPCYKIKKHKQSQADMQDLTMMSNTKYSIFHNHIRELQNLLELSRECRLTLQQCCLKQFNMTMDTIGDLDLDSIDGSVATELQTAQYRHSHPFLIDKLTAVKYKVPEEVLEHDPAGNLLEYRSCYVCRRSFVDWWIGEGPWPTVSGVEKIARYFRHNRKHLRTVMSESGLSCDEDGTEKELNANDETSSKSCSSLRIDLLSPNKHSSDFYDK